MALRAHDVIPTPSVIESICCGVKRARRARFTPQQTATLQTDAVSKGVLWETPLGMGCSHPADANIPSLIFILRIAAGKRCLRF